MSFHAWLTLGVLAGAVVLLVRESYPASATLLAALVALLVAGVLTPQQALVGFSNPAPVTVAALYVLARAVEKTGMLQPAVAAMLGEGKHLRRALAALLVPTAAASAFVNNTPVVAMLVPQVSNWAGKQGQSRSWFLMPISFAAILGGVITVIGTSTNLVVSGLLEGSGRAPLGMFELSRVGLPIAVVGVALLVWLTPILLPDRKSARDKLEGDAREFVISMEVVPGGPLDGVAVEEGGLRRLQGVYLVELEREGDTIAPVAPTDRLRGGDRLTFVGRADLIVDLQRMKGLVSSEQRHVAHFDEARHRFYEAVLGPGSPLLGRTLKEIEFRGTYQAAVVAIHRAGHRVRAKLGAVPLRMGDTLVLLADPLFARRWQDRRVFLLVAPLDGAAPAAGRKAWIVASIAAVIVVGAALGVLPILHLSLAGAVALVGFRVLRPGEARDAVDLDVVVVIAAAFGLGAAMEVTGLASHLGRLVVNGFGAFGGVGALAGVALSTMFLTHVVSNNAAAALMFPIAIATAGELGLNPRAFAVAVAISASAAFLTPIAYQTNLMVYGPGGYRFADYARLGWVLAVVVLVATVILVPIGWGL